MLTRAVTIADLRTVCAQLGDSILVILRIVIDPMLNGLIHTSYSNAFFHIQCIPLSVELSLTSPDPRIL